MEKEIRFLFWNTGNKLTSVEEELEIIFIKCKYDIIVLAESKNALSNNFCQKHNLEEVELKIAGKEILKQRIYKNILYNIIELNPLNNIPGEEPEERVISTTLFGVLIERTIKNIARIVLLELKVNGSEYLLACVHLPSKKNLDEISQLQATHNYKRLILERAPAYEHKVIIVGDFNMNPFDAGMVEPHGFFALNYNEIVKNKTDFQFSTETMLYNPSWMLLGDNDKSKFKLPGTHYYSGALSKKLYWHLFDQVIISEEMIEKFIHSEFEIIEIKGLINEVSIKKPKKEDAVFSDHLPIKFTLKL